MRGRAIRGWAATIVLCFLYSLLLTAHSYWLFLRDALWPLVPVFIATLFVVALGGCVGVARFCRKRELDARGYWRSALLALLAVPVLDVFYDAPPIENDYSVRDITPTNPAILASYDTLMTLGKNGGMKVSTPITCELEVECRSNAMAHAKLIYQAWDDIAAARAVIEKLDTYPGIADITPQVPLDYNTPILNFMTLRSVVWTYAAYAHLKTAEGQPEEAARQLARLQSVSRKAMPYAVTLVDKMIWIAIANDNMHAAFALMQNAACSSNALEILREGFPVIPEADISLRRPLIGEYVGIKTICIEELGPSTFLNAFDMTEIDGTGQIVNPPRSPSFTRKMTSCLVYYLTFRRNRTLRDLRAYYDLMVEGAGQHPPDMAQADALAEAYSRRPDIRNLGGWSLVSIAVPSFAFAGKRAFETKILSDLLAIEINVRLNHPMALRDDYAGGPYQRDPQAGRLFSVGPDRMPHTEDDVWLGKE